MDERQLREIERQVEVGRSLPGSNRYALDTMGDLVAEVRRLQAALRALYESTHDYLNVTDEAGRMAAGTPRLNAALADAHAALQAK